MTQGFPPGQQVPHAYPQAGYPQQPQPQAGYPQPGPPQQNAQGPRTESGSRGWLVALGVITLALPVYVFVMEFANYAVDLEWDLLSMFVIESILRLILPVAGCAVILRSVVARWVLVVASAVLIALTVVGNLFDANGSYWGLLLLILPVAVLVLAFLPPVNRAFRKVPASGTPTRMGYNTANVAQQGFPQPQHQPMPHQQAQGYPQQAWQQRPR